MVRSTSVQYECTWHEYMSTDVFEYMAYVSKRSPVQVAETGGWLVEHQSMMFLDKHLDENPCSNHRFLEQNEILIQKKIENPSMRVGKLSGNLFPEHCEVKEERQQGLMRPKRKFITVDAYTKRYGAPDINKIKTMRVDGQDIKGLDVVEEQDQGVFEYIDQSINTVSRTTKLSDAELCHFRHGFKAVGDGAKR